MIVFALVVFGVLGWWEWIAEVWNRAKDLGLAYDQGRLNGFQQGVEAERGRVFVETCACGRPRRRK